MITVREALADILRCAPEGLVATLREAARRDRDNRLEEAALYELRVREECAHLQAAGMGCPLRDEPVGVRP